MSKPKFVPAPQIRDQIFNKKKHEAPSLQKYLDDPQALCTNCSRIFHIDPFTEVANQLRLKIVKMGRPARWKINQYQCPGCIQSHSFVDEWPVLPSNKRL